MNDFDIYSISQEFASVRLDRWIKIIYPSFRQNEIEVALRKKKIKVNQKKAKSNYRLQLDDKVFVDFNFKKYKEERKYQYDSFSKKQIENMTIFQDDELLILNKPPGIAVQGGTKIKKNIDDLLKSSFKSIKTRLVHRIDKETSGILIIALNRQIADHLSNLFREKKIIKKKEILIFLTFIGSILIFIYSQILTKNQIFIFSLIPMCLGFSHTYIQKYFNKNKRKGFEC